MNKQQALIILNQYPKELRDNDNFITLWTTYNKMYYCNTINDALEQINKTTNRNKHIALEINDHFISDLKDWYCETY